MASDPWFSIFPAAAAVTFAALAASLLRRRGALGGAGPDWAAALLLAAGGFGGPLIASAVNWNSGGDLAAAAGGTGGALGLLGAFSGLMQRYTRGRWGSARIRWALFASGLGLAAFGLGAGVGGARELGDGAVSEWVIVPVAGGVVALFPVLVKVAQRGWQRAGAAATVQLCLGGALVGAGFLAVALGDLLVGSGLAMVGGGVLYSGVIAGAAKAPPERAPPVKPKVETAEPAGSTAGTGRKVRVPKGAAVRETSHGDGEGRGGR